MTQETRLPRIYLAGDLVFRPDATALFETFKAICRAQGLEGVSPFDGQAEVARLPPGRRKGLTIARLDRALMDACDGGLFCVDPFRRAPDMDPGTAVEIGYMAAQGKPLAGYTTDGRAYPEKVREYFAAAWHEPLVPGADGPRDADGMLVHSEGLLQNAMVEGFIAQAGGSIAVAGTIGEAFARAAAALAALLRAGVSRSPELPAQ